MNIKDVERKVDSDMHKKCPYLWQSKVTEGFQDVSCDGMLGISYCTHKIWPFTKEPLNLTIYNTFTFKRNINL